MDLGNSGIVLCRGNKGADQLRSNSISNVLCMVRPRIELATY